MMRAARFLFLAPLFIAPLLSAQVAINADGSAPDPSAMLEVTSTGSGILIPRMTAEQRDNIPSPATGLMVYVVDDHLFHFYNGTEWTAIAVPDGDGSATNELQTLSLTDKTLHLSDGGSVDLENADLSSKWTTTEGAIYHSAGNVGIGTDDPSTTLDVNGTFRIRGGDPEAGKVLTATGFSGAASWQHLVLPMAQGIHEEFSSYVTLIDSTTWREVDGSLTMEFSNDQGGAKALVLVSFSMRYDDNDPNAEGETAVRFRVRSDGIFFDEVGPEIGPVSLRESENWSIYSFHSLLEYPTGNTIGFPVDVDFILEVTSEENLTTSELEFQNVVISVVQIQP